MRHKYFTKEIKPTLAVADAGMNAAFSDGDVLFDWTAFTVPLGGRLIGAHVEIRPKGDSGATPNIFPLELIFSMHKQENTTGDIFAQPKSLGALNSAPANPTTITSSTDMFIGQVPIVAADFFTAHDSLALASTSDTNGIVFMNKEDFNERQLTGTKGHTQGKFYVAGIAGGALDFRSETLIDNGDLDGPTMTVQGTDPRLHIALGDTVAVCTTAETTAQKAMGIVSGLTSTSIVLTEAFTTADVANDDIVYNQNPIRIVLTLEY